MIFARNNTAIRRFILWFFAANSVIFCLAGVSYLHKILSADSLFINYNSHTTYLSLTGKLFVLSFTFANYISFMMVLAAIPAVLLVLISELIPSKRFVLTMAPLVAGVCVLLLILDSRIYSMFHFHLNAPIMALIFNRHWITVFEFSNLEAGLIGVSILFILLLQYGVARLVWKKVNQCQRIPVGNVIVILWAGSILFCYSALCLSIFRANNIFSQQIPTLPLYSQLLAYVLPVHDGADYVRRRVESDFVQPAFSGDKLRYPLKPLQCETGKKPLNIILIMVDSLRFDMLTSKYMPNMTRWAEKNWQFDRHYSGGNGTQPGVFSVYYSIPSTYFTAALEQKISPVLIEQMLKSQYDFGVFWSAEMEAPNFNDTIFQRFPDLRRDNAPGIYISDRDQHITREAQTFLTENGHKKPFFLSMFYDAVHGYCSTQNIPEIYQPTEACFRIVTSNDTDPTPARNRYLNAVNFMDLELSRLMNTIETLGYLDDSVVILTSDHGEEFNDNHQNYWGHTSNFSDTQVHVPLIIHWPGKSAQTFDYLTSAYDIVPTLMQDVFGCKNPVGDYSIGQNLLQENGRRPFVLAGSYINTGLIEHDRLTTLQTSGLITITDRQVKPLRNAEPRMNHIHEAMALMRKYFTK